MSDYKLVPVEPTPEMDAVLKRFWIGRCEWNVLLAAAPEPDVEPVSKQVLEKALRRAYHLGQTFLQQADSESYAENRRAEQTRLKFEALVNETVAAFDAAPQPAKREPLTDERIEACFPFEWQGDYYKSWRAEVFAKIIAAIEAAHGITGAQK